MDARSQLEVRLNPLIELASKLTVPPQGGNIIEVGSQSGCELVREVVEEILHREDIHQQRFQQLELQYTHLNRSLHQAGIANQNSRLALNDIQAQYDQLQSTYAAEQAARRKCDDELQNERLEHRATRESLTHEINSHADTEKTLGCCWESLKKMGDLCDYINQTLDGKPAPEDREKQFGYADLVMENEFRKQAIEDLEKKLTREEEKDIQIAALTQQLQDEAAQHEESLKLKEHQIAELELKLEKPPMATRRKRRARGSNGIADRRLEISC